MAVVPGLIYVDQNGCYGNARGLLIINLEDVGGWSEFDAALDKEGDLRAWTEEALAETDTAMEAFFIGQSGEVFEESMTWSLQSNFDDLEWLRDEYED
jgi:hypothetical protein